jgi:hypothetical protein
MPDRDHWSASMLLRWVLTRDIEAVLSMLNDYGGSLVEGDKVRRVQPQTWDDVMRAYSIDDSLQKEEQVRNAVLKAELFLIPAQEEICSSLRRGEVDAWARPNGSGDIVKIAPIQWAGLRFRALEGHDIAVPVDSEENPLHAATTRRPSVRFGTGDQHANGVARPTIPGRASVEVMADPRRRNARGCTGTASCRKLAVRAPHARLRVILACTS